MEYIITIAFVVLCTAVGIFLRWLRKNDDYFKIRGIPYDPRKSLIPFLLSITSKNHHDMFLESYKKHGRLYGGFEMRKPVLTVCEPDLLRDILVKDFHIFNYRRDMDVGDPMVSNMLTALKGENWKRVRTIITPAFTSKKMRQISHIINECSQTVVQTLGEYVDKQQPVDCKRIFGAFTMDVIASSAFATKIDSHHNPDNIFVKHAKEAFQTPPLVLLLSLFVIPSWITKRLRLATLPSADFFKKVILQVLQERRKTGKKYGDILQLLMDAQDELEGENSKNLIKPEEDETDQFGSITNNGMMFRQKYKKLTENELVAQCVLFFIVGYETTASTLSYMAYCLALNPESQDKLISEIDATFKKHNKLNYDEIREMKYLDCVLSETLRLYPALTRSERTACEDFKLGNTGTTIEKGTLIGFNIQAMHLDADFFPSPEKFDPERFMDGNANHPQYAYLPFGAGPRNCLGMRFAIMEIKLLMSNILRHYRFKKAETTKIPLKFRNGQGLLTVDDLPLMVERRNT